MNPAGYYDAGGAGGIQACGVGLTSQARKATSASACVACPVVNYELTTGDACGDWACVSGSAKRGDLCYDTTRCVGGGVGYGYASGAGCTPGGLPWNPAGWAPTGAYVASVNSTGLAYPYHDYFNASGVGVTGGYGYVLVISGGAAPPISAPPISGISGGAAFYTSAYGFYQRNTLVVTGKAPVAIPGRVCSAGMAGINGRSYVIMAFCNATFLSFVDLANGATRRLIGSGNATDGYVEGYRDEALFGRELYVATDGSGQRVYVNDRLNCAVRVVWIPTYPGDFLTRSYWVYGSTAGTCYQNVGAIRLPAQLYPLLVSGALFYVFPAEDGLYQLDDATRQVQQILPIGMWPASAPALAQLLRVDPLPVFTSPAGLLALRFQNATVALAAGAAPGAAGSTSTVGLACLVSCPAGVNYVDLSTGACESCGSLQCGIGEELVPCGTYSAGACVPCPELEPLDGLYPRVYNLAGSCAAQNVNYVEYCRAGTYLGSQVKPVKTAF